MKHQIPLPPDVRADLGVTAGGSTHQIASDLAFKTLGFVNVGFVGAPHAGDRQWVLIDAGVPGTAGIIEKASAERFSEDSRPGAIILTHGHVDHAGALEDLGKKWDAPIYAHPLETPYLDGRASYPPNDPTVGGGLMAWLAPLFPVGPVDVSQWLRRLPADGSVPAMPGWRWLHTPGHSPGHVSLWRESDRTLIVGDAFVTHNVESAYESLLARTPEIHGPPRYITTDWISAKRSVETLAALEPELVLTGHGHPLRGPEMREALHRLARDFDQIAVPAEGRYVDEPARADENGPTYVPPKK